MRVLFTSSPGYGHLQPMLPMARALRDAGDEVGIATVPELLPRAEAAGFTVMRAGDDFGDWWPDVIVHESFEFAAPIAAAAAVIPSVHHTLSPLFGDDVLHLAAEAVAPLWRVHGLEPGAAAREGQTEIACVPAPADVVEIVRQL